ncbi:hypothetical protein [Gracilibacillus salinarum]|uniref:DUF3995 domain-containing protein n=1 Tax=Gracilibacillus salinarum TaxID=2932255 RepID=A0ABY4GKK2_9BACI|nr:hypothetical protein [Gracilibacillus salinarum]UOQ83977.1 hypothetical protein MUN87_14710 [Gracilibacillus salinarum]
MENILRKSSFYGLLFGLAIAILVISYKDVQVNNGVRHITYMPVFEYIIQILRVGIIGMFLGLFIGWKGYEKKYKSQQERRTYYLPFFFIVFIISTILMAIFNW